MGSGVTGDVAGDDEPRVRGLRPGDPQQVGAYQILGRLGEGGMGSVYLATRRRAARSR